MSALGFEQEAQFCLKLDDNHLLSLKEHHLLESFPEFIIQEYNVFPDCNQNHKFVELLARSALNLCLNVRLIAQLLYVKLLLSDHCEFAMVLIIIKLAPKLNLLYLALSESLPRLLHSRPE